MTSTIETATADRQLKARHRAMWASGDYPAVAAELLPELGPALVAACGWARGSECWTSRRGRGTGGSWPGWAAEPLAQPQAVRAGLPAVVSLRAVVAPTATIAIAQVTTTAAGASSSAMPRIAHAAAAA